MMNVIDMENRLQLMFDDWFDYSLEGFVLNMYPATRHQACAAHYVQRERLRRRRDAD